VSVTVSTCQACQAAAQNPVGDLWENGCFGCQARAFAVLGMHTESAELGAMTQRYRQALERVFAGRWKEAHEAVKAWGAQVKKHKAGAGNV